MGEILFLAHRMPFPPDRGDKIRSHHLLKALTKLAPVHVGCFGENDADFQHETELRQVAASHCLVRRDKGLARAGLEALRTGKPVSLTAFDNFELRDWVRIAIDKRGIDTIFVFSGQMGQYVPNHFDGRLVIDLCDVDSAKFDAYGAQRSFPRSWIDRREGRLLAAEEARLATRARHTLLISDSEAQLFQSRLPDASRADIRVLRNGIDHVLFDPQAVQPHPDLSTSKGPHLVFTGQMDYLPNVEAAERAMDAILPAVRQRHPEAMLHIVGRAPVEKLRKRDGQGGIRVWGEVPDVRPYLAAADLVVAPLAIARGVQNKVLEAMAMERPVLLTPGAATGIDAEDGRDFAVADSDEQLVALALDLLADGPAALSMAAAARRYVVAQQGWDAMLEPLAGLVGRRWPAVKRDAA